MADQQTQVDWGKAVPFGTQPQGQPAEMESSEKPSAPVDWSKATPFASEATSQAAPTAQAPVAAQAPTTAQSIEQYQQSPEALREAIAASSGMGEFTMDQKSNDAAYHMMLGALKGLADTGHVIGATGNTIATKLTGGKIPQVVHFATPDYLKAQGAPETVGKVGEGIAEFFLGDGVAMAGLKTAEKFKQVSEVLRVLEQSPRLMEALHVGMSALRMGTVGAVQSVSDQAKAGGPIDLNRAMHEGAATGLFGGAMEGFGRIATNPAASTWMRYAARAGQGVIAIPTTVEEAKSALTPRQANETEAEYEDRVIRAGVNAALGALGMKDLVASEEAKAAAGATVKAGKVVGAATKDVGEFAVGAAKEGAKMVAAPVAVRTAPPEKLLEMAVRPYLSERDFTENAPRTLKYLTEENKKKPIENLEGLSDAAFNAKQRLWESKLSTPHPDQYISGDAIAKDIKDAISPTTRRHFKSQAEAIEDWADTFKGQYPLDEALGAISQLNADLRGFYKLSASEQWRAAAADPKLGMLQDAADSLREHAFKKLEDIGEKDVPELRKDYGALNQLQRVSEKRAVVYGRQAPIDLKSSIGAIAAVASGHPQVAAIPLLAKYANSPDFLIKRAMKTAGKKSPKVEAGEQPALGSLPAQMIKPWLERVPEGLDVKSVLNHELGHAAVAHKVGFDPQYIISGEEPSIKASEKDDPSRSYGAVVMNWGRELDKKPDGTFPIENLSARIHDILTSTMAGAAANEVYDGVPLEEGRLVEGDKKFAKELLTLLDIPEEHHEFYMRRAFERAKSLLQDEHTTNLINEFSDTREPNLPNSHLYSAWRMEEFKNRLGEKGQYGSNAERIAESDPEHSAVSKAVGEEAAAAGASTAAEGVRAEGGLQPSGATAAERSVPTERSTGNTEWDGAIKEGGAIPGGFEKGDPESGVPDMVLFHDPLSGSSMYLPTHDVSVKRVEEELLKTHLMFETAEKKITGEKAAKIEQGRIKGRPEWVQASLGREINRAKDILRNPEATPEEKKYAEQVLESSKELQERPGLANLEARAVIANEKPGQRKE